MIQLYPGGQTKCHYYGGKEGEALATGPVITETLLVTGSEVKGC